MGCCFSSTSKELPGIGKEGLENKSFSETPKNTYVTNPKLETDDSSITITKIKPINADELIATSITPIEKVKTATPGEDNKNKATTKHNKETVSPPRTESHIYDPVGDLDSPIVIEITDKGEPDHYYNKEDGPSLYYNDTETPQEVRDVEDESDGMYAELDENIYKEIDNDEGVSYYILLIIYSTYVFFFIKPVFLCICISYYSHPM